MIKTTRLNIQGMTCDHCRDSVEKALKNHPGVLDATVHLGSGTAEVNYEEGSVAPEQLVAEVKATGYQADIA